MDCSPPDSSVRRILQARILEGLPFLSPELYVCAYVCVCVCVCVCMCIYIYIYIYIYIHTYICIYIHPLG